MYVDEQVRMRSMHARTPANKPARGRCTSARGRASQHEADGRVHAGEQVSTSPVHACRAGCWLARMTCSSARHSINTHGAVQASRNNNIPAKLAVALSIVLCLCVPFAILSFQLATGLEPSFQSAVPLESPVRIAIYSFTFLVHGGNRRCQG